jgi:autotransporter-associated beta strand protein
MIITAGTVKGKACAIAGTLMVNGGIWDLGGAQRQIGILTGAGPGALTQNGPGTLTLSSTLNDYSGLTTVAGGTLAVKSAQTSQAGAISVSDGATLKVNVSGTSQPPPSSLIVGSSRGGTLEFNGITSETTAPLNVTRALTINGSASIKIDSLPATAAVNDSYPLVAYGSGGSGTLTINSMPAGYAGHLTTGSSPIRLVVDDVPLPHIGLSATTPLATEGGNAGAITLTRSEKTNQPVTVGYSISGTASNGVDYTQLSGTVDLAAGQTQSVIYVDALVDAVAEPVETVTLNLNPSGNYKIVGIGSASVLIADDTNGGYSILAFDDEFNGAGLDGSVWAFQPGRTNVAVTNGSLELIPHKIGTTWTDGSIQTTNYAAKYGFYEGRMKVNDASGLNNAFWLNTPADMVSGNTVDRTEMDITEAHYYDNSSHMTLHDWAPTHWGSGSSATIPNISDSDHAVGLEWKNSNTLVFYWDGVAKHTLSSATLLSADTMIPLSVLFSANVASFAGSPGAGLDGSSMFVDYVRIWQKPGWTGAFNGNWGSGTNWGPDGVPGSGEAAVFNGPSTNTAVSLAADKFCHSLCFDNAACPAFTFPGGAYSLHLGAAVDGVGGITICSSVTNSQTINLNLVADRDLQIGNFSRTPNTTLLLNGNVTGLASGRNLQFCGFAPIQVIGGLSANIGGDHQMGAKHRATHRHQCANRNH